ncbi:MAG TPA: transglycosylase domain-containing protein [Kofleriaceae bacterium]|nr:transglycosylase domain-containing protein [Kofleriaceae bacterium]
MVVRAWRWFRPPLLVLAGLWAAATSALIIAVYAFPYDTGRLDPGEGGPLIITDRNGQVLRTVPAADGRPGREAWVPLDRIPSHAVLAVIASEDAHFWEHRGVDGRGVLRAAWLNLRERRVGYGGSTITMQLARMIHSPVQGRGLTDKIAETVQAMRMERALSKREILEQYLNRAYYGHGAYGIEAAAQTYFGRPAAALSPAEAVFLAVLPRAPTAYDPIEHRAAALRRRDHVLDMLVDRDLLAADEAERWKAQPIDARLHVPPDRAPHFVDWVLSTLPDEVRARGGVVRTTLDVDLQERLERRVAEHVDALADRNLAHAGMVVLDTHTGQVLAMVGSADYQGEDGQVNIVTRRRHPGSALKPFVYALALEAGDNPSSIAMDILDVPSSQYRVVQLTQKEHGPVRYREALAGSYNLAAIHTLEKVGIGSLMTVLRKAGVPVDGDEADYGLRLALGSAKVRLIDLAAAYGFVARDGYVRSPSAVLEARDGAGRRWQPAPPVERSLFSAQTSWLVMDMLADSEARRKVFGQELPLDLPFPVAAKTGTSRGFADTVAVGVTSEVTVAAWAGNFDGRPTEGLRAMTSAAPLVRAGLLAAADGRMLTLPAPPEGIEEVDLCPLSGLRAGPNCPHRIREKVAAGRAPAKSCDWHGADGRVRWPSEAQRWADREAARGGRDVAAAR